MITEIDPDTVLDDFRMIAKEPAALVSSEITKDSSQAFQVTDFTLEIVIAHPLPALSKLQLQVPN